MTKPNFPPLMVFHDFEANPSGTKLAEWPLHITIVPFFDLASATEQQVVDVIMANSRFVTKSFEVTTGDTAMYGPNGDIPVTRINNTETLQVLHLGLMNALGGIGCVFLDLTYAKDNYSPHISHKLGVDIPSSPILVNSLSLVREDKRIIRLMEL
ncbi:MAG TPA: 2'-5' RNA ligase family protein [Candidatus Saccharimonadia bacterium]|nr:2'-5' RNA ligase family protein [Candidatus Saccharimonadia bacterium]